MTEIKLFISYKTKQKLLSNDILTPIQTGRAISDEIFDGMIGDDTGDNISKDNPRYCELTAQYWVWKNYDEIGNPDYVGFMHYRRQFIFDEKLIHLPFKWLFHTEFYFVKSIDKNYIEHFSKAKILSHLSHDTDCIAYKRVNMSYCSTNMKEHFYTGMPAQKKEVFEIFENVFLETYPEYKDTFLEFKNNTYMFCCNSFIMKKDLFFEYSEFLFNILSKVDNLVDYNNFNKQELRFLGYLGEYIMSIFLFHKLKDDKFKLKELPGTFISNKYKQYTYLNYWKCKIFRNFTFGKRREHYIEKKYKIKQQLDLAKKSKNKGKN